MLQLLICDDDTVFANLLHESLSIFWKSSNLIVYFSVITDETDARLFSQFYDIAYLDIDMPKQNGFELSRRLKERNPYIDIIFITAKDGLVLHSFDFHPYDFICKSDLSLVLEYKTKELISRWNKKNYQYSYNGSIAQIPYMNILYIKKSGNDLYLQTTNEFFRQRKTMRIIQSELPDYFLHIQKAYIVNLYHVKSLNSDTILLDNKEILPVALSLRKKVAEIYSRFLRGI